MLSFPSIQPPSFPIEITYEDIASESKKENGDIRVRRKFTTARITFNLTWNAMSISDYQTLENFYVNDCQTNVQEFEWAYPSVRLYHKKIPNSIFHGKTFAVRFTKFSAKASEHSYYTVNITLKGVEYRAKESEPVFGQIIPIVYDNVHTYLIDNTFIDGRLVWGTTTTNTSTGFVNSYTKDYFFNDDSIVDADTNADHVFTAKMDIDNKYLIYAEDEVVNASSVNQLYVERDNTKYKHFDAQYLLRDIIKLMDDFKDTLRTEVSTFRGIFDAEVVESKAVDYALWNSFKVDSDGYFHVASFVIYEHKGELYYTTCPGIGITSELVKEDTSERTTASNLTQQLFQRFKNNAYIKSRKIEVTQGYRDLNGVTFSPNYNYIYHTNIQVSDKSDKVQYCREPYIGGTKALTLNPRDYIYDHTPTGITPITYNYLGYIGGTPRPSASQCQSIIKEKHANKEYGISIVERGYAASSSINTTQMTYDNDGNILTEYFEPTQKSYYRGSFVVGFLSTKGETFEHSGFYDCVYTIRRNFKKIYDIKERLPKINAINYIDIPIQDNYVARFTYTKIKERNVEYGFVGIYLLDSFVVQPSISISITDNLSIIQLSDGSYLLGIYKKGLYRVRPDGSCTLLINKKSKLYNFRLHYQQNNN